MKDVLRIYVLYHLESTSAFSAADAIAKHFDGLGMERDGVAYRVPVRFRSEAWDVSNRWRRGASFLTMQSTTPSFFSTTTLPRATWRPGTSMCKRPVPRCAQGTTSMFIFHFHARRRATVYPPMALRNTLANIDRSKICLTKRLARSGCCCIFCNGSAPTCDISAVPVSVLDHCSSVTPRRTATKRRGELSSTSTVGDRTCRWIHSMTPRNSCPARITRNASRMRSAQVRSLPSCQMFTTPGHGASSN